jgi:predicted ester cyclase
MDKNDRLGGLFDQHRERKQREAQAAGAKAATEEQWTKGCVKPLLAEVRPAIEDFIARSNSAGHHAGFTERMDNYVYPSIEFEFTPAATETHSFASQLTFQCHHPQGVKVLRNISNSSGQVRSASSETIHPVEKITRQWAENQLFGFVKDVLAAN